MDNNNLTVAIKLAWNSIIPSKEWVYKPETKYTYEDEESVVSRTVAHCLAE